jgi:hypothetical protein
MNRDPDIGEAELLRYLMGEVTATRGAEIDHHLDECPRCASDLAEMKAMVRGVADCDPEEPPDLLPEVRRRIRQGSVAAGPRRSRWPVLAFVAMAAVALLVVVPAVRDTREPVDEEPRAKAAAASGVGAWVGMQVFRVDADDRAERLTEGSRLRASDGLVVSYANLRGSTFSYLMVFGIDAHGEVRWYYPAYADPAADPVSIPIARGVADMELPEKVRHALPGGPLVLYALFTTTPVRVSAVETVVVDLLARGSLDPASPRPLAIEGAAQQTLTLEVLP